MVERDNKGRFIKGFKNPKIVRNLGERYVHEYKNQEIILNLNK